MLRCLFERSFLFIGFTYFFRDLSMVKTLIMQVRRRLNDGQTKIFVTFVWPSYDPRWTYVDLRLIIFYLHLILLWVLGRNLSSVRLIPLNKSRENNTFCLDDHLRWFYFFLFLIFTWNLFNGISSNNKGQIKVISPSFDLCFTIVWPTLNHHLVSYPHHLTLVWLLFERR